MAPFRVLVVDDSVVVRRLVSGVLDAEPLIDVVGTAPHGGLALTKIEQLEPDLVTLDIEMPVMDGIEALTEIRRRWPRLPVVMFSTLTERGAAATLEALERGADDYVTKPSNTGSIETSREAVRAALVPKVLALCGSRRGLRGPLLGRPRPTTPRPVRVSPAGAGRLVGNRVDVLAVGASTGGPDALTAVLSSLPATLPIPVVVVQHMPPVFTRQFADRLDVKCGLSVREAQGGEVLTPGEVLIAPGNFHLSVDRVAGRVVTVLDQEEPENFCRPAVDVLFRSVAAVFGRHTLALVMTGMGSDGAAGATAVVDRGGTVLVQDEDSSVVWGMPGATVAAGAAAQQLALPAIAPAVLGRAAARRASLTVGSS